MKNSNTLFLTQIFTMIFCASLFFSCDMDTSKLTSKSEDSTSSEEYAPTSAEIGTVDIEFCDSNVDNHHGCHCRFNDAGGSGIFLSNMHKSKSACISINGKTEILTGKRMDDREDHMRHSYIPDWIVLDHDNDVHIFNEKVDDANYEANKDLIYQTMLVMHDLPKEMKIRKITGSKDQTVPAELASRYEKMWSEALTMATSERAKGNHGSPLEIKLSNETFDVTVKGNVEKHNADGSDSYTGNIEIKSKSGKVIGSKEFTGICLCED